MVFLYLFLCSRSRTDSVRPCPSSSTASERGVFFSTVGIHLLCVSVLDPPCFAVPGLSKGCILRNCMLVPIRRLQCGRCPASISSSIVHFLSSSGSTSRVNPGFLHPCRIGPPARARSQQKGSDRCLPFTPPRAFHLKGLGLFSKPLSPPFVDGSGRVPRTGALGATAPRWNGQKGRFPAHVRCFVRPWDLRFKASVVNVDRNQNPSLMNPSHPRLLRPDLGSEIWPSTSCESRKRHRRRTSAAREEFTKSRVLGTRYGCDSFRHAGGT